MLEISQVSKQWGGGVGGVLEHEKTDMELQS